MTKKFILGFTIIMFFFKSSAIANYEKTFFDLNIESISGEIINFSDFKNNAVLIVNTASYCGFTNQYEELQILWDKYKSKGLVVLAVPSNSFNQEKNKNSEVKEFCDPRIQSIKKTIEEVFNVDIHHHSLYFYGTKKES